MSVHPRTRGLQRLLQDGDPSGVQELRVLLHSLLGESAELLEERMIWRARVYRVRIRTENGVRSLILKRLPPDRAFREQCVLRQWLPRLGLAEHGSPLVGVAAATNGETVWHVYDDLGESTLDRRMELPLVSADSLLPAQDETLAAVELVARLHTSFADCGFLGEVRQYGLDLGLPFLRGALTDARNALQAGRDRFPGSDAAARHTLASLLERLQALHAEEPERMRQLAEHGGVETFLHGDLWTCNVVVLPGCTTPAAAEANDALHVRLIDWDHAGVGYVSYDLSAFLLRFPLERREGVLEAYADAVSRAGWGLPEPLVLNALFDTAERARLVSSVLWPALAYRESGADWALEQLAEVERWFDALNPVLPLS